THSPRLVPVSSPGSHTPFPECFPPSVPRLSTASSAGSSRSWPPGYPQAARRFCPHCPVPVHNIGPQSARLLHLRAALYASTLADSARSGRRSIEREPIMSTTPFPLPIMLDASDRKALRARAHHLDPVIMIGEAGLTRAVLDETDRALRAHELIKVRVLGDDRAQRQAMSTEICSALGCAAVQSIGKLLVLYRPRPIEDGPRGDEPHVPKKRAAQGVTAPRKPGSRAGKATKRTTGGATGARVTTKRAIDGAAKGRSTAKRTASGTTNARTGKAAP